MKKFLFIALLMLGCTSCATVFCGGKKRVTFDSDHNAPVTAIVDGHRYKNVTFPFKVKVRRGFNDTEVRFMSEGYHNEDVVVDKTFNWVAVLNLMDPVGWAIDLATGAITKPEYDHYWIDFTPLLPESLE